MSAAEGHVPDRAAVHRDGEPRSETRKAARIIGWARENTLLLAVFAAFSAAATIVPTLSPVATTDDWAYARSAQILLEEGRLVVFPVVAATAVFQIVWGALFGALFGPSLGVFRLSTVVITALGALALYGLCRELGVSRGRGALGVAAYLFNPLVFVLAFTFMTDAHFVALLVVSTWLFVKGVGGGTPGTTSSPTPALTPWPPLPAHWERGNVDVETRSRFATHPTATLPSPSALGEGLGVRDTWFLLAGSAVAALAFLTRQQGALIVPAVVLFLLVTRRLRFDRASVVLLLQVLALPALAVAGYVLWLRYGNDVPRVQVSFFREVLQEGWSGTWWLVRRLAVVDLIYLGFFTLPLMAAVIPFTRRLAAGMSRSGWFVFGIWAIVATAGVAALWMRGARMPYIAQFFGPGGLGPPDVLGSRPRIMVADLRAALTIVCLLASLLLALVAARALSGNAGERVPPAIDGGDLGSHRAQAGLVFSIALWQVIGIFPPSYHYIGWAAGSLDRYLLPLAPLAVALALWGLRGTPLALPLGWVIAMALALFSVAGTRDYLVFMREVWTMGDRALAAGVPLERLDAGSGWDGYHLYEYGLENRIRSRTPKGGPWWVYFYAPATDSAYVVAGKPLPGHGVVMKQPYSSWLSPRPVYLYLLRRLGEPWPPYGAGGGPSFPPWNERESPPARTPNPRGTAATGSEVADE